MMSAGVSISTIWRRRVSLQIEMRIQQSRRSLSKEELIEIIRELRVTNPDIGIIMIEGEVSARGLHARRSDIGEALCEMDPLGGILRWNAQLPRVVYRVPGTRRFKHA